MPRVFRSVAGLALALLLGQCAAAVRGGLGADRLARVAAIEHFEEMIADGEEALRVLRRSPTFKEHLWLGEETAGSEASDPRGEPDGTRPDLARR